MDLGVIAGGEKYEGLPAGAVTIRNSVRTTGACPRRWLFREGEGLQPERSARALSFGDAFHKLMQEIHLFWMYCPTEPYPMLAGQFPHECPICQYTEHCPSCEGTKLGAFERIRATWLQAGIEDDEGDFETLEFVVYGWLRKYGFTCPVDFEVVGIEVSIAMPIRSRGRIYRTPVWVTQGPRGQWRRARHGEVLKQPPGCTVTNAKLPVYLVGTLDVVWRDLNSGKLYVGEHKSSNDPQRYMSNLTVDPQVQTYEILLASAIEAGVLERQTANHRPILPGTEVVGHWYRVSSSKKQRQPKLVKATGGGQRPTENRADLRACPSWLYEEALNSLDIPIDDHYESLLRGLQVSVDQVRYQEEFGASPRDLLARCVRENLTLAKSEAQRWRQAATSNPRGVRADGLFPRVPVCRFEFGSCPYRVPCEGDDGRFARNGLKVDEPLDLTADHPSRIVGW